MSRVVVDASAIVSVILPDEHGPFAALVLSTIEASAIAVPPHWPLEVANAVVVALRRKRFLEVDSGKITARAAALVVTATAHPHAPTENLIIMAIETGLTAYDAAYVDLARRLGCPLLTGDKQMRAAAHALAIPVIQ